MPRPKQAPSTWATPRAEPYSQEALPMGLKPGPMRLREDTILKVLIPLQRIIGTRALKPEVPAAGGID